MDIRTLYRNGLILDGIIALRLRINTYENVVFIGFWLSVTCMFFAIIFATSVYVSVAAMSWAFGFAYMAWHTRCTLKKIYAHIIQDVELARMLESD